MKTPKRLQPLVDEGFIDEVLSQLMSGKEANVYAVRCGEAIRCAKVYKATEQRSFKKSALYLEGRKTKNTREARAIEKGSNYGRKRQEDVWQNAEVDALYRLASAGVRVPEPYLCTDGVLLMALICDENGNVAPRLGDISLNAQDALFLHQQGIEQVVLMLCAGMIHGDLSEYNILVDEQGLVIIDLPQAVDAAANRHAQTMLSRDINNLRNYFGQFAPELLKTNYADEIWHFYANGTLSSETPLTGHITLIQKEIHLDDVMKNIEHADREERERRSQQAERDQEERALRPKGRSR